MKSSRYQEAARELLRETLLDAAGELLEKAPWAEINLTAVATTAGVSRQTLYREFGSRDDFAQAYVLREAGRFMTSVEDELRAHPDDPSVAVRSSFQRFLEEIEHNPLVKNLALPATGSDELFANFTTRGEPVVKMAAGRLASIFCELWPGFARDRADILSSLLVRLAISHAGLPEGTPEKTAHDIVVVVEPFLAGTASASGS